MKQDKIERIEEDHLRSNTAAVTISIPAVTRLEINKNNETRKRNEPVYHVSKIYGTHIPSIWDRDWQAS